MTGGFQQPTGEWDSTGAIGQARNIPYASSLAIVRFSLPQFHDVATLTSNGQIPLPKSTRQAPGVDIGAKVAFDLRDGEVIVTRVKADHEDPAIGAFLSLLEADIRSGRHIGSLPDGLARAQWKNEYMCT